MLNIKSLAAMGAALMLAACGSGAGAPDQAETAVPDAVETSTGLIPYERFTLDNGLDVIFHIDRSDPVVAVSLTAHVGSAREKPGRTGFAHLFEHLLFLESENLGKGGLDRLSARIGGSGANGSTNRDRTNYFQTVPKDALEKMIWAEADKLGWFINTVTQPVLDKEKQVVKNEKRQVVDNRPYGHTFYVLHKALYPQDHPYNWQVIGSLEDLQAATLDDVKEFFRAWYTPNNVTLVVAGDFDAAQARDWVEKYFDEIPRGPDIAPLEKRAGMISETVSLFHEDNFAEQPELTMLWPTVPRYHPDSYALSALAQILADGKAAPLNQILIDEKQLTANVGAFDFTSELAGEFILQVTAFADTDLDAVKAALEEGFARFEADGVPADRLARVKIQQEVAFYEGLQNVLGKNISLANYSIFAGDPGFIDEDLARLQSVAAEDVMRVYETYIKDQPFVVTSFVPKGQAELALEGAARAEVVEEEIVQGAERGFDPSLISNYEPTPSTFDRSVEPPSGAAPVLATPDIWEAETDKGLRLYGIEDSELPLVQFQLVIEGGRLLETREAAGAANLVAEMMTRGTAGMTAEAFDNALADLGADVDVNAGLETITVNGSALARNFDAVMALVQDMVVEPRWDPAEFELAKKDALDAIQAARANPNAIAQQAFDYVMYGEGSIVAQHPSGNETSLAALDLAAVQAFHAANLSPQLATLRVVGDVPQAQVVAAAEALSEVWEVREVDIPAPPTANAPDASRVYFYDVPGASQSVFYFGGPAPLRTDEAYYPTTVMNYRLGGGGFASRLTQQLREQRGYTYGIGSGFASTTRFGEFFVRSGVRSNVTLEAADLVKSIMTDYAATFDQNDLDVTKSFFVKSKARSFESYGAKLRILRDVSAYGLPHDYVAKENEVVEAMTVEEIQALAAQAVRPDAMHYVIVGDAATQLDRLADLGLGDPILVNEAVDALSR
ncbi:MAG: pitrilysin family protein [Pseudomonadota bacterium]